MMRILIILCSVLASVTAFSENLYLDMVFVVDDSSRLREFKMPDGDRLLYRLMVNFFDDVWPKFQGQVALVTYGDKPLLPWMPFDRTGNNYCSKRRLWLEPKHTEFLQELHDLTYGVQASDFEEMTDAHAGLMMAMDTNIGWRRPTRETPVLRLIILVAGARPRQPGAGLHNCMEPLQYFEPNKGDFFYDCPKTDYYSTGQVLATMQKLKVLPYIFTWWGFSRPYKDMIEALGRGKLETFRADVSEVLRAFHSENSNVLLTLGEKDPLLID